MHNEICIFEVFYWVLIFMHSSLLPKARYVPTARRALSRPFSVLSAPLSDFFHHTLVLTIFRHNSCKCNFIVLFCFTLQTLFLEIHPYCLWNYFILLLHIISLNENTLTIFTHWWVFGLFPVWTIMNKATGNILV